MSKLPLRWLWPALLALVTLSCARAQELSLLGGTMSTHDGKFSTYSYQVDYRQNLSRFAAASVAYLNEGHVPNHHRDGTAFQVWGRLPLFRGRIALSAGVGPYFFYDTQPLAGRDSADVHGVAYLYSVSANAYLDDRWFLKATLNRIEPHGQLNTSTAAIGIGYWFGQDRKPTKGALGDAPPEQAYVTPSELTLFGGKSIVNTFFSQNAVAWGLEYRRGVRPHVDWTVTGIHEGDPKIVRRNGVATQGWLVNTFFDRRVSVGIGLGPYIYIDRRHPSTQVRWSPAAAAVLVSLSASTRLSAHWDARAVFNRVTTDYNRDSDVLLVGLGYRWR